MSENLPINKTRHIKRGDRRAFTLYSGIGYATLSDYYLDTHSRKWQEIKPEYDEWIRLGRPEGKPVNSDGSPANVNIHVHVHVHIHKDYEDEKPNPGYRFPKKEIG